MKILLLLVCVVLSVLICRFRKIPYRHLVWMPALMWAVSLLAWLVLGKVWVPLVVLAATVGGLYCIYWLLRTMQSDIR